MTCSCTEKVKILEIGMILFCAYRNDYSSLNLACIPHEMKIVLFNFIFNFYQKKKKKKIYLKGLAVSSESVKV